MKEAQQMSKWMNACFHMWDSVYLCTCHFWFFCIQREWPLFSILYHEQRTYSPNSSMFYLSFQILLKSVPLLISKSVMIFLFSSVLKHFLAISHIWHSPCSLPAGYNIFCPIFLYVFSCPQYLIQCFFMMSFLFF